MPTANDVRAFLNNISDQRVPDTTIEKNIDVAKTKVLSVKGSGANQLQIESATLLYAAFLSYGAYAVEMEKAVGAVPPQVSAQLSLLDRLSKDFLELIARGTPTVYTPVAQPETLLDQYESGELTGELY